MTQVTYNNSTTNFDQAIHKALKRIFGYAEFLGETKYQLQNGIVQVCPITEYRILLKNDEIFENRVEGDGIEDGTFLLKDYATKKTEKYIIIRQSTTI
jgi:hypothetical protein